MKRILSLILALTLILSFGSFMASAATEEATNVTTVAPINYANQEIYPDVSIMRSGTAGANGNLIIRPTDEATVRAGSITSTSAVYSNSLTSSTHNSANAWFAIDLGETRDISKVELVQHYNKIKDYKIYYTNDTDVIADIRTRTLVYNGGLTEDGKVAKQTKEKTANWADVEITDWYDSTTDTPSEGDYGVNMRYHGQGIIDKLNLLASGTLTDKSHLTANGSDGQLNAATNVAVDEIAFPETTARCVVLVVENDYANRGTSMMLWSFKVLGTTEKNSTDFAQYPKQYPNYADKSVYTDVQICSANNTEGASKVNTYGSIETLVDPNSTVQNSSTGSTYTFMLSNTDAEGNKSKTPYSWFAIDLGQVRSVGEIDIYQWKDRISKVEIYSLTAEGYSQADQFGGNGSTSKFSLTESFMNNYTTHLKTQSVYHTGDTSFALNTGAELTTPSIITLDSEVQTQYILVRVSEVINANSGVFLRRVHVKSTTPVVSYENAYPESGLDYTVKFVNDIGATKRYALIEAQYNVNGEMIANNIKYVNVDPAYAKSFSGKITKVDGATEIKVFSWCLSDLAPMETEYTFNIQ